MLPKKPGVLSLALSALLLIIGAASQGVGWAKEPATASAGFTSDANKGSLIILAGRYQEASRRNHKACLAWCQAHKPYCITCSRAPGCGPRYRSIKSFRGRGRNWYACALTRHSAAGDRISAACWAWCRANPQCMRCSRLPGCGRGYRRVRTFRGTGFNWYACRRR